MQNIYTLVYASSASWRMEEAELQDILQKARNHNSRVDISGLLLYAEGNFLQILEGDEDQVNALYDKIEKDRRHTGMIRLMTLRSDERNFPDWSMGYKRISSQDLEASVPGFSDFFHSKAVSQNMKDKMNAAIWTMLTSFRKIVNT